MGRGEVHKGFWRGSLKEIPRLEETAVDGRIVLTWIFRKRDGMNHRVP
jgi:hypothetical protein